MTTPLPTGARPHVRTTSIPRALASLAPWVDAGVFGTAEVHATEVMTRAAEDADPMLQLAAACALWAPLHGHACVDLEQVDSIVVSELAVSLATDATSAGDATATIAAIASTLPWPALATWLDQLRSSELVRHVHGSDASPVLDERPLVLHGSRLYTQRQWVDECIVADQLLRRAALQPRPPLTPAAATLLDDLLPPVDDGRPNLQHVAARTAISAGLSVIVGGPGTGKTHTIARTLAVMACEAAERGASLRIGLAAPTGKAAARLGEAIASAAETGVPSGPIVAETSTIHRMLGWRGSTTRFRHDAATPLPFDVVVIDEASMVALPLMARLLEAVRPDARVVLVGDPDQLHSIEVGAVLADIVSAAADPSSPLHSLVVRLQRARRQQQGSPIPPLADAVRDDRPADAMALLAARSADAGGEPPLLSFIDAVDPLAAEGGAGVRDVVLDPFVAAATAARVGDAAGALAAFATLRVLCAHRTGRHGAESWNRAIEGWLFDALDGPQHGRPPRFYPGRPLLATRNDQRQRVANGDTGIVISDPAGVRAAFGTGAGIRVLAPAQLERVETAFATTIHKSQGSEFDAVVVILPPAGSPLAGRELLYTAITRAARRLVVVGTAAAVAACIASPSRRVTGLAAALSGQTPTSAAPIRSTKLS